MGKTKEMTKKVAVIERDKDTEHTRQHLDLIRGQNKAHLRRSYNSLNNLKALVQKDKEEDFMLGVNRDVEKQIKEQRNNYDT